MSTCDPYHLWHKLLSGRTLYGEVRRTRVDGRDLASTYVLRPLTIALSQILEKQSSRSLRRYSRLHWRRQRRRRRLEVCADGCTMVNIWTDPIIHDLFVYVSMGMNVSTKRKDNKMIMERKKHDNQKWNITRILEFQIRDKSENEE